MASSPNRTWLWLVPFLLLITWLGVRGLDAEAFWYDEYWSVYYSGGAQFGPLSPIQIWNRTIEDLVLPPGYYFALAAWGAGVGWTAFAGRALSLLVGLLALATTYRLGRDMISPLGGLSAAIMMGASAFFVRYTYELRTYTLYALFAALLLYTYWRLITCRGGRYTQFVFFLTALGLLYTHYFAALLLVGIGLYHLLFVPKTTAWLRPPVLMALAGLLFLPWGSVMVNAVDLVKGQARAFALDSKTVVQIVLGDFSNGNVALLALLALYGLRWRQQPRWLIWLVGVVVLGLSLATNEWLKLIPGSRYLIGLWPILALIAAFGIEQLARDGAKPAFILSVALIGGLAGILAPAKAVDQPVAALPWDSLARTLAPQAHADDKVLFLLPFPTVIASHRPVIDYYTYRLPGRYELIESPRQIGADSYKTFAQGHIANSTRVWVGYDPRYTWVDHMEQLDQVLVKSHILCGTVANTAKLHLNLYARLPDPEHATSFRFGDATANVTLNLLDPLPSTTSGAIDVVLGLSRSNAVPLGVYSISLRVEDTNGHMVGQVDFGLPDALFACQVSRLPTLPPGKYTLYAVVYAWQTGQRLPSTVSSTSQQGDQLSLGSFTVNNVGDKP